RCLHTLYFPEIHRRIDEIDDADAKTFEWILEPENHPQKGEQGLRFRNWLSNPDENANTFWISGKPGAGKSTLMKYLADSSHLSTYLKDWSGDKEVIQVQYYFWRQGSRIQRSLQGLLRSLLLQILSQHHDMIRTAFPDLEWQNYGLEFEFPEKSLTNALKKIVDAAEESHLYLFFLIDGLDEFDDREELDDALGDVEELLKFLSQFSSRKRIKLCVSSRTLNFLEERFSKYPQLCIRIDEITQEDIRVYIRDELEENDIFRDLSRSNEEYLNIVQEMAHMAQGVFLWVRLVSKELRRLLTNGAQLRTLREKLSEMPKEIEGFY
ncbi:hypothetical protein DM02DRAFT_490641, partial [Periconia macrospinosa]